LTGLHIIGIKLSKTIFANAVAGLNSKRPKRQIASPISISCMAAPNPIMSGIIQPVIAGNAPDITLNTLGMMHPSAT